MEIDVCNLDDYLAGIIHEGLVEFKKVLMEDGTGSYPGGFIEDYFSEITEEQDKENFNRWLDIIDQMIYAFNTDNQPEITDYDFGFTYNQKTYMMELDNTEGYNQYQKDLEAWKAKQVEGRELFVKYLDNLWI